MNSDKADRLRHVAEVAVLMADGKAIQQQDRDGKWHDIQADVDAIAERIMRCGQKYRVRPEPVESVEIVGEDSDGDLCVYLDPERFKKGWHVTVKKLED